VSDRAQIRLSDADITAAVEALQLLLPKQFKSAEYAVLHVVKAINSKRGGDPQGTVRYCYYHNGTCAVAVRVVGEDGAHFWKVTHPDGKTDEIDSDLHNWTRVPL
jgi:hypothetical protein